MIKNFEGHFERSRKSIQEKRKKQLVGVEVHEGW